MKIVNSPRRTGKTTTLARWLCKDFHNRIIIVHSEAARKHVIDAIKQVLDEQGLNMPPYRLGQRVKTARDYKTAGITDRRSGLQSLQIAVDELQLVLDSLGLDKVQIVTGTFEEVAHARSDI